MLAQYGEERFARQIARAIVRRRAKQPFERTGDLVDVIKSAIPTPSRFGQGHPAKRSFQALRIAVNDELESLREGLETLLDVLAARRPDGRDLASTRWRTGSSSGSSATEPRGCTCPPDFPICVCGHEPLLRSLTSRAVVPTVEERSLNSALRIRQAARCREDGRRVSVAAPAPRTAAPRRSAAPRPRPPASRDRSQRGRRGVLSGAVLWIIAAGGAVRRDRRAERRRAARHHRRQPLESEAESLKQQNAALASAGGRR